MAWHSKWHNIKHKKAAWDAKKSSNYAKIWKMIQMAARSGADASMNPSLELALSKAKYYNLPKDVVQRAIEKWSWVWWWDNLSQLFYEWYAPGWVALLITCITDNTNRSAANVRSLLAKAGWQIGEPGSVAWQFVEKWVIFVDWVYKKETVRWKLEESIIAFDLDQLEMNLIELPIMDYKVDDWICKVTTDKLSFIDTKKWLESLWYHLDSAELAYEPTNPIAVSDADWDRVQIIIDLLDEDDDVDQVFTNAE